MSKKELMSTNFDTTVTTALDNIGIECINHAENDKGNIVVKYDKEVDGEKQTCEVYIRDDREKQAVKAIDAIMNVESASPAILSASFAYMYELGTWRDCGFKKFSDYAMSINRKLADNTIRKYVNIGCCFFKQGTIEPEFVDARLKNNGVSVSALDAVISTFKAFAEKREVDGKNGINYRDHVSAFLDEFFDPENGIVKIHLGTNAKAVKDDCAVLAGRKTSDEKKQEKKQDEPQQLTPYEEVVLAMKNYVTSSGDKLVWLQNALEEVLAQLEKIEEANA